MVDLNGFPRFKVTVIGTINKDTIIFPDGKRTESFGGILYNLSALSGLGRKRMEIYPVCNLGYDVYNQVEGILKKHDNVKLAGINKVRRKNNHAYLLIDKESQREEILRNRVPALSFVQVKPFLNSGAILVNFISGFDIGLNTLKRIRTNTDALIFMDIHSLALGIHKDGKRFLKTPRSWREYLKQADLVQTNLLELNVLSKKRLKSLKGIRDFGNYVLSLGTNLKGQAGLFLDIKNMNDVDYINLGTNNSTQNATATQLLSRVNVFYNFENDYIGSYFKYYKDLTLSTNRDTLQKLPTLHYHHYVESFLKDHVLFDIDMQTHNIVRDVNKNSLQTDINIPVTLQTSLFDEYLNVSYTSYFYGQHSSFSGSEQIQTGIYNDGVFARQYNMFEASTQVVRAYDDYSHSMGFGTRYTLSGLETTDGYYSDNKDFCSDIQNQNDPRCEFYNITDVDEAIQLDFTQYLFNISGEQIIYHRLAQVIADEDSNLGELENELEYKITDNIDFYNNMFFNYDEKSFSKLLNKITYNDQSFNVSLSHLFKDTFIQTATLSSQTSYITSSARYTYDSHYSYHVGLNYDLENSQKKSAEIGFLYKKRCWDFGMRYLENNRPILTSNNVSSSIYDRYVYFSIAFKPFMSSDTTATDYGIKLSETLQGN